MPTDLIKKGLNLLLRRQTNILSAAFIIMATVILSQALGLIRQRLLVYLFGVSNTGLYLVASQLPDSLFQLVIAAAISTAFIPVFTDYLTKGKEKEGHQMASTLIFLSFFVFLILSIVLCVFAPFFLQLFNLGSGYSASQMLLMVNLMRIIIFAQLLFIVAMFFSALLQSYNHFFIPGIAAALYNLGIIVGIVTLSKTGIYAPAIGNIIGALFFILMQLPLVWKIGFRFQPEYTWKNSGVLKISRMMWPRTIAIGVSQISTIATVTLVSFLAFPASNYTILDYARTLAFAPVVLFGQTIAQAAFPVLAREKDNPEEFKLTLITSINQMLYLVLPITVLMLVLRIPIVRLIYGASPKFDWPATVLTGRTLAFYSLSIFSQSLINLVSRAFYALHNTKIPLLVSFITTILMLVLAYGGIILYKMGVESIAISYSFASIIQLIILMLLLDKITFGFSKRRLLFPMIKIFVATFFTAIALYIPIKLLDRLVFDTTKTINLLVLTGISSFAGLSLYLFLTWLFNVNEAVAFFMLFKKMGNWKEILRKVDEKL